MCVSQQQAHVVSCREVGNDDQIVLAQLQQAEFEMEQIEDIAYLDRLVGRVGEGLAPIGTVGEQRIGIAQPGKQRLQL